MDPKKLSHYEIVEQIGAGGMGEVFRARDPKLDRDVALKLLPESFAADAERLARFEREARLLASLNHPHIASIHGIDHDGGRRFLVLELVEGQDLSERLRATGRIPIDEVLSIARQICEALESAHDQGVVHRDLKPANIIVRPDGAVKVLDFGLAKALDVEQASGNLSHSPTVLASSPTMQGVILGTAAYMSPEQARGRPVDQRSDIFSFGCVLYEMLSGTQCFKGDTVSDTLASVLARDPDWDALPANTPPALRRLLERCLDKDPKRRLRDIGEARIVIEDILTGAAAPGTAPAAPAATVTGKGSRVPWIAAAFFFLLAVASLLKQQSGNTPAPLTFVEVSPPQGAPFELGSVHPGPAAISPDGRRIVYTARSPEGGNVLWVRFLEENESRPLPGTDGAGYPFWSPDSRSIGFFVAGSLRRIEAAGGPPVTICKAPLGKGGTWNTDGTIIFAPTYNTGIHVVEAGGGEPRPVTEVNTAVGEDSHRFPAMLPGGRHFLFFARSLGSAEGREIGSHIHAGSIDGKTNKDLFPCRTQAIYAAGHILFMRESTLMARPFDPDALEFTGDPVPVVDPVRVLAPASRGIFSASNNGTLLYMRGAEVAGSQLELVDRNGGRIELFGDRAEFWNPALSPDGKNVAVQITESRSGFWDIWIYDMERKIRSRFTTAAGATSGSPAWSPDGSRIAFRRMRASESNIYIKSFAGTDTATVFRPNNFPDTPFSWSPDGKYLFIERGMDGQADIVVMPLDPDQPEFAFAQSQYNEIHPYVSPDGKWLAYSSNESGRLEVYVAPFPGPGRKYQISSDGGIEPRWRADGEELFFQTLGGELRSVSIGHVGTSLAIGNSQSLFRLPTGADYSATADGQAFILVSERGQTTSPLTLVFNWPALLKNRR